MGPDRDFDFDFDRDNDLTDWPPFVLVLAASSCTWTCTASLRTCTFLGRAFEDAFSDGLWLDRLPPDDRETETEMKLGS